MKRHVELSKGRLEGVIESLVFAGLSDAEIRAEVKAALKSARAAHAKAYAPRPPVK